MANNFMSPRNQGLLALASGLLQASGPSPTPVGFGPALGQAGMQGLGAFNQASELGMLNELRGAQLAALQRPENPFGKINPKDFTQESVARFAQSNNPADLVPARAMQVGPAGQVFDPYRVQPGTVLPDPNKPFAMGPQGPVPNLPFQDYARELAKSGATQVNVGPTGVDYGSPPQGMAWARTPDGKVALRKDPKTGFESPVAVPIAGGPVETKAAEAAEAKATKEQQQRRYADVVTQDVTRAVDLVKKSKIPVTGFGSLASAVPGSPAHDLSQLLNTVKANIGFDRLQQMRAASPTGGALGQVSEFENRLLQATFGALEQSQSEEQFLYNLQRVGDTYLDIIHGPGNRPSAGATQEQKPSDRPKKGDVVDGWEFTGGDPGNKMNWRRKK